MTNLQLLLQILSVDASQMDADECDDYLVRAIPSIGKRPNFLALTSDEWDTAESAIQDSVDACKARYKSLTGEDWE